MGVFDTQRRPILPAPTDSLLGSADEASGAAVDADVDVATDLSHATDRSHHTIPDDGRPITIATAAAASKHRTGLGKAAKLTNSSQTSLLIEYFEHGPESGRKPSVRVKVTPSSGRRGQDQRGTTASAKPGHVVVTEASTKGDRRPSQSHRIALGRGLVDSTVSTLDSDADLDHQPSPLEIEVNQGGGSSDLSRNMESPELRYMAPASDISSMPPDSMLGVSTVASAVDRNTDRTREKDKENQSLPPPPLLSTARNLSNERIAQKVIEKISNKPRTSTRTAGAKSSVSRDVDLVAAEPTRRRAKQLDDESGTGTGSATGSSLLSGSLVSADIRAADVRSSVRSSGMSNVSVNNPKLLQTVEDVIRRLILPELKEIKKDQRQASHSRSTSAKDKDVQLSDVSETSLSREELPVPRHSSTKSKSKSKRRSSGRVSSGSRRHEAAANVAYDTASEHSYAPSESLDSVSVEDDLKPRRHRRTHHHRSSRSGSHAQGSHSQGKRDLGVPAVAAAALTAAALKHHDSASTLDSSRERRKKRSKSHGSRTATATGSATTSASLAESEEIFHKHGVPPMPMRSEVETEFTRSSLLSSKTASTATPGQREVRQVARGSPTMPTPVLDAAPSTPPPPHHHHSTSSAAADTTAADLRRGLGTHHGNFSEHDLVVSHADDDVVDEKEHHHQHQLDNEEEADGEPDYGSNDTYSSPGLGTSSFGHGLLTDPERARAYESNLHHQHPIRRGLSPIQSVASYATTAEPNRNSLLHTRSIESFRSGRKEADQMSIASVSSAPSTDLLARSRRPQGISLENRSEIMQPHGSERDIGAAAAAAAAAYTNSTSDGSKDEHRRSNYTDTTDDKVDFVSAGRELSFGHGSSPQYIHPSAAVESVVASLCEPSVLTTQTQKSASPSASDTVDRELSTGSPLKHQYSFEGDEQLKGPVHLTLHSPPQSPARSFDEHGDTPNQYDDRLAKSSDTLTRGSAALEDATEASPESEITTNPSVIQGPIAGYATANRDHWPYDPTAPAPGNIISPGRATSSRDLGPVHHANLVPEALAIGPRAATGANAESKLLPAAATAAAVAAAAATTTTTTEPAPLAGAHDEGYETGVTAANVPSPVAHNERALPQSGLQLNDPLGADKAVAPVDVDDVDEAEQDDDDDDDDPFTTRKRREYVSGLSQGMSPLYDSATGRGIDRIKSKDVVALMDHLTVRDAQRSARDTEILMTLVTTAAEMRNSFEDMKKFIADQGDELLDTADKYHDTTQKSLGGLQQQQHQLQRQHQHQHQHQQSQQQQPVSASSSAKLLRSTVPPSEEDDLPTRRRNIFRRAFRGLGNKNSQELQHIETLLTQLLDEVDSLKSMQLAAASQPQPVAVHQQQDRQLQQLQPQQKQAPRSTSFASVDQGHPPTDPGYEPEGQAGTSSTGDRSGFFSNNSSRQANYRGGGGQTVGTGNRVSTVIERDEEGEYEARELSTPRPYYRDRDRDPDLDTDQETDQDGGGVRHARSSSVPVHTPPRLAGDVDQGALSSEQPGRYYSLEPSSGGKKHRSFASNILPKMTLSRWSKTTASSTGDYRSGLPANNAAYEYDPQGDDRLRSNTSLQQERQQERALLEQGLDQNRPSSPLIPSQVSENPKYQAHRNSVNLQHPQPRQGPTGRYQNTLENEAQYYHNQDATSPTSVTSSQWENQAAIAAMTDGIPHNQDYQAGRGHYSYDGAPQQASSVIFTRAGQPSAQAQAQAQAQAPPRPPKVPAAAASDVDSEPLVPPRPPKQLMSPGPGVAGRQATYVDHVTAARTGSPAYDKSPISALRSSPAQVRKPSGPRPLSRNNGASATSGDMSGIKKTRFRGSPYHIDSSD